MEKRNKNQAVIDYIVWIQSSWTYERLTREEQTRLLDTITNIDLRGDIFGSYHQRWTQLNAIYTAFLAALDYKPIGWRE